MGFLIYMILDGEARCIMKISYLRHQGVKPLLFKVGFQNILFKIRYILDNQ